jgi:hypothetical protein
MTEYRGDFMHRLLILLGLMVFLSLPGHGAESGVGAGGGQPTPAPGEWDWIPQEMPPLAAILALPKQDRPVYGLYCWENEYRAHRSFINEVGWRNFRLSGPINDEIMRMYAEDGAEVMYTMPARKPFASPGAVHGEWRNRGSFDTDEAFIADYLGDVTQVLERYGPGGKFWKENPALTAAPLKYVEIFNEPNFWYLDTKREDKANHYPPKDPVARKAQEESRQKLYAKLLVASHAHIKTRWPEVSVVGFAAGGAAGADVPFIRGVHALQPEVGRSYDILSTHPYVRPAPPEGGNKRSFGTFRIIDSTNKIRKIMEGAGAGGKPLWWTELNWTIYPDKGGAFVEKLPGGAANNSRDVSPELQAAFNVRTYAMAVRLGVARLHFMSLVDTDGVNSGMLNKDHTPRPSALAVKNMISLMPFPRILEVVRENEDGIYIYRFNPDASKPGNAPVTMAYRVQGPARVTLPWDKPEAEMTGMLGDKRTVKAEAGKLSLEIGPLPVYLR